MCIRIRVVAYTHRLLLLFMQVPASGSAASTVGLRSCLCTATAKGCSGQAQNKEGLSCGEEALSAACPDLSESELVVGRPCLFVCYAPTCSTASLSHCTASSLRSGSVSQAHWHWSGRLVRLTPSGAWKRAFLYQTKTSIEITRHGGYASCHSGVGAEYPRNYTSSSESINILR